MVWREIRAVVTVWGGGGGGGKFRVFTVVWSGDRFMELLLGVGGGGEANSGSCYSGVVRVDGRRGRQIQGVVTVVWSG